MTKWQPWAKSNLRCLLHPFIYSSRFPIWEKRKWKTKLPYSFIIEKENFLPSVPPTYNRRVRLTISPCLRKISFRKRVSSFPLFPWPVNSIAFSIVVVIKEKVWSPSPDNKPLPLENQQKISAHWSALAHFCSLHFQRWVIFAITKLIAIDR